MLTATYGLRAETFMERLLHAARIRSAASDFLPETLLNTAKVVNPRRYQATNEHIRLNRAGSRELLDHLFGVDHVIDLGERIYVSVDTTVSPSAVAKKMAKGNGLSQLRAAVGIHQHIVLLVVGDFDTPNPEVLAKSIDQFWTLMCDAINGPANRVRFFRLHVS